MIVKLSKFNVDNIEIAYSPELNCILIFKYFPKSENEIILDITHETLHAVLGKIDRKLGFKESIINKIVEMIKE